MKTRLLPLLLAVLCVRAFPGEPPKVMPAARDTVIVPYDPKKPVKDQQPGQVYLGYDRFLQLWEAAKKTRAGDKPPFAAAAFALGMARYEGRVEEKRVALTAAIELTTFDEKWVRVPLPFQGVQISELALDGKPAAFADGALVVETPGRHVLTVTFEIPLRAGVREFGWGVPETAATRLLLTLPEVWWSARIQPDAGIIERTVEGKKAVTAALGTTGRIQVALVESEAAARLVEPAVAEVETAVTSFAAYERFQTTVAFAFPDARQDRFTVKFTKDLALIALDTPGMKSWKLTEEAGQQTLEVTLAEPAKETYRIGAELERLQSQVIPAERTAPIFTPGARRIEQAVLLYSGPGMDITAEPAAGLRQVELARPAKEGATLVGAWAGDGALGYRVGLAQPKHEARVDYVYQVNRRKIELIASLQLHAKGGPLLDASLTLPAGFDVQAVDSARLQDWWRDGEKLRVRFKGGTPEMTPLVVYLFREYAAAPQQLDVQPLALDGFAKVTGEAVIAAHKGVDVALKLAENGDAEPAKEVDPAEAAPDFQILPPLERKRGFAFKNQLFSGEVTLAAMPVKQNTIWVMHAQAHEAWVSLSLKARLSLRQGSLERTSFSLPATLPEAHVSGDEVRETRSRVEGDRRIYEVAFQNDVYDTVDLTVDVDVAMSEGKRPDGRKVNDFTLPVPAFPEALLVTGYVLADNASEYELKLETEGADQAPTTEIPWLPSLAKGAGVFRVQPIWKVTLVLERLEKAEARTAFCAWADMTTALRDDGTEWHKAVWHLQNRSLQFLPVKLPAGAVLVSARVAGQAVRADTGTVNGGPAILIPLIKTKPGDVSYDVEVVWRREGVRLPLFGQQTFNDAELPGITVEQTFWTMWLPEDRKLLKADGNMEEVIEVLREVEKARSAVDELRLLNGILSDQSVSQETRSNAKRNWDEVYSQVQKQVDFNGGVLRSGRYAGKEERGERKKQEEQLVNKAIEGNEMVVQELSKVAAENKRVQETVQNQQDVSGVVSAPAADQRAQALLFGANSYQGNTVTSSGTLTVTGSGTLTVNGNIANADAGNRRDGERAAQGQQMAPLRWTANPSAQGAQQEGAPAQKPGNLQNFYLNDNVVLQQAKAAQQPAAPAKTEAAEEISREKLYKSLDELADLQKDQSKGGKSSGQEKRREEAMDQDKDRGLNIARGNRAQQIEQMQQAAPPREPSLPPPPNAQPAPPPTTPAPVLQTAPTAPTSNAQSQGGMGPGGGGGRVSFGRQDSGGLQTAGRLSLAVDFPTEGHVYHFQKVKANAVLELKFSDPKITERLIRIGIFAALAVALWLLGRLKRTRRAQAPGELA